MKKTFRLILLFSLSMAAIGCKSTGAETYRITFDPAVDNLFVQSAWIAYTAPIRNDMLQHYKKYPKGDYIVPYNVETDARNNLINFYSQIKKENEIYDDYIEDLIKIRTAGMLNEYIFFSFNPGNWINDKNFEKDSYMEWMNDNMSAHIPLTLAHVEKLKAP